MPAVREASPAVGVGGNRRVGRNRKIVRPARWSIRARRSSDN